MTTTPTTTTPTSDAVDLPENIRGILARCRDFIDTTKVPAYPAGADLADEIDALLAAQGFRDGAVPQRWKTVPVNPTPEMWKAAKSVPDPNPPYPPHYGLVWDAMLAASPTPPAEQQAAHKAAPGEQNTAPAEWLEQAYHEGWAACRDAETIGEEAEDWAFGNSTANSRMIDAQQAVPQPAPHLPERDASLPAERQGLFRKFVVSRVDGSDKLGGKHYGCTYFVLDVDHDPCARPALAAYAAACESTHPTLAADLRTKWGMVPAPQPAPAPLSDDVVQDAAFEAVRKKLCALPRFSFLSDGYGVRRVPDKSGSWIAFDAAHALFDPVAVDAALAAQGGK